MKKRGGKNGQHLYLRNLQRKVKIDAKDLRRKVNRALEVSGLSFARVGIILVNDRRMAGYNRKFLGLNRPTDVLSFHLDSREGEILISAETARVQAKELRHPLAEELLTLAIHGFLHLTGHDDRTAKDRRLMFAETRRILKGVSLRANEGSVANSKRDCRGLRPRNDLHGR